MPFVIGFNDYVPEAVVGGGGYVPELPLTNIQTDDLEEVARTSSLLPADTKFTVDLGTTKAIGIIAIKVNNASPDLTYRIRSYADAGLTTVQLDTGVLSIESGTVVDWTDTNDWLEWEDANFWSGITPSEYGDLPLYIIYTVPIAQISAATARFWLIELFDEDNPDTYLDIASAMLFQIYRPEFNYEPGGTFSFEFLQDENESKGGRRVFHEVGIRRQARFSWPSISEDAGFDNWMRIVLRSRTSRRIFIIPEDTETGDRLRLRAFPATFKTAPALAQLNIDRASTAIDVLEVI